MRRLIDKVTLDRLKDKVIHLSFDCPYCKSSRIEMRDSQAQDFWEGVRCGKCRALVILDSLSVVVIKDAARA